MGASGINGAVAGGSAMSVAAGLDAMKRGGNAVDAAVSAGFMACVAEPAMTGLGGHGRMGIYWARDGRTVGIDHFIRAPRAATRARYDEAVARAGGDADAAYDRGALSVGVFGLVAGLCAAHRLFARMSLSALLEPAIAAAEHGVPFDHYTRRSIAVRRKHIAAMPDAAALLLRSDAATPSDGMDTRAMARTLKEIARHGEVAVYRGPVAEAIETELRRHGGLMTAADLGAYAPAIFQETPASYRDYRYTTCSEPIATETLNILEQLPLDGAGIDSVTYRHYFAEAQAHAFVDGFAYLGSPDDVSVPFDGLASKAYARARAAAIAPDRATASIRPGDPWRYQPGTQHAMSPPAARALEGTTKVCAADSDGNFASLITSLGSQFGALIQVPETGIWLGNAMKWFAPQLGVANTVAPGRMPVYGAPVFIAQQDGRACAAIAGSGGYRIQSAVLMTFLNKAVHGMALQDAVDAPRQYHQGQELEIDGRTGNGTIAALAAMGHRVKPIPFDENAWPFARPAAVWRDPDGMFHAASDSRAGAAAAY